MELFSARPAEDYYEGNRPDLFDLFAELSSAYAYFGGKKDDEIAEVQNYRFALEEAYDVQWQNKMLLYPDVERARRLLSEGKLSDFEDICLEILLVEYPEEVPYETAEDVEETSWDCVLDGVFSDDAAKGVEMWRTLLDAAEPALKTSRETANVLLRDWDWLKSLKPDQALALLTALDDARFASQLFESASVGAAQLDVLKVCRDHGREDLGKHCLELALKNPRIGESWAKRLGQVFSEALLPRQGKLRSYTAGEPVADTKPDDGTVYHYCSVQVQETRRPYSYLTGGLPLKVGDWVELPFGKDNAPRQGQIKAVMDCTRMAAPWPPEQTKTVIRVIDAPATEPTAEAAVPEVERRAERQDSTGVSSAPRKPFPFKTLIAVILTVTVIVWAYFDVSNRRNEKAAAYEAAIQEMSSGDYASAEQGFSELSGYRDTTEKIAAESAAKQRQSLKDQYSGKLPLEGMPVCCLKYTSLGEPDQRLNCKNFDRLETNQQYFHVYWYDENGDMIAAGMCAQWKNDSEFMLKSFSQYYPSGGNKGQTFNYGGGSSDSRSIQDDYDDPEDLWEDNTDWYEDEDEVWDEWHDD